MPTANADIDTSEAARLVKRLCTHRAHEFAVAFDDTTSARLRAGGKRLHVIVEAADEATRERFQGVVASHLQRMARAGELAIHWRPGAGG